MWILPLVGYAGLLLGFSFLTLAIASGLYYLSELVEEHTVLARKVLTRLIYSVLLTQTLLALVDGFPFWISALSVASHVIYMGNLRHFPIVKLSDPVFILSCALVLINHTLCFRHFSRPLNQTTSYRNPNYNPTYNPSNRYTPYPQSTRLPTFTEVASYFGICVWLVPFALFVSLSASENVLPSMGSEYATGGEVRSEGLGMGGGGGGMGMGTRRGGKRKKGLVKAGVEWVVGWVGAVGERGRF